MITRKAEGCEQLEWQAASKQAKQRKHGFNGRKRAATQPEVLGNLKSVVRTTTLQVLFIIEKLHPQFNAPTLSPNGNAVEATVQPWSSLANPIKLAVVRYLRGLRAGGSLGRENENEEAALHYSKRRGIGTSMSEPSKRAPIFPMLPEEASK